LGAHRGGTGGAALDLGRRPCPAGARGAARRGRGGPRLPSPALTHPPAGMSEDEHSTGPVGHDGPSPDGARRARQPIGRDARRPLIVPRVEIAQDGPEPQPFRDVPLFLTLTRSPASGTAPRCPSV